MSISKIIIYIWVGKNNQNYKVLQRGPKQSFFVTKCVSKRRLSTGGEENSER